MTSQSSNGTGKPRVLFVVDSHFPVIGGAESQALKLAVALRERGGHVDFLTPQLDQSDPLVDTHCGFAIKRFSYPHVRYLGTLFMMINFARCLIASRRDYDFVHIHITRYLSATAGLIRPFIKLPMMTKISGFFEFEGGVLDMNGGFQPVNWLLRKAVRNIDYVHTISQQTRSKLIEAGFAESQIRFIPNGVATGDIPAESPKRERVVIGYCGRLRHVKGVDVLIDAIALLKKNNPQPDIELRIAGDGETMDELRHQVAKLGLIDTVVFLGAISDTATFYNGLDVYVQPSFAEGLPNSVIEAMNAGMPVIASDIGGNQDLVIDGNTGYLFKAGDAELLSNKLNTLLSEPTQRLLMGKAGRMRIEEHFDIAQVVEQLVDVYRG